MVATGGMKIMDTYEAAVASLEMKCREQSKLIASLQASLAESEARVRGLLGELSVCQKQLTLEQQSVNELAAANYDVHQENKRLREALEKISGSGPIPDPYSAWSWCYDVAKQALAGGAE